MNKNPKEVEKAEPAEIRRSSRLLQRKSKRVNKMQSPGKTIDTDLIKDIPVKPGDAFDNGSSSNQLHQLKVSEDDSAKSQSSVIIQQDKNEILMDFVIYKLKNNQSRPVLQMRFGADKIKKIESKIENGCSDQAIYEELRETTQDIVANQADYSNFMSRLNFYSTPTYTSDQYELIDNGHIDNIRKINNESEHKNKDALKKPIYQENNVQKSKCQQKTEHKKNNYGYFETFRETELVQNNPSQSFTSSCCDIDNPVVLQKDPVNSNATTEDDFIQEVIIIDDNDSIKSPAQSQKKDINKYDSCALTIPDQFIVYEQEDNFDSEQSVALASESLMLEATLSSQITKQKKPDSDDDPLNDSGKESVRNYDHSQKSPILCLKDVNNAKLDEVENNSPKNLINEKSNATCKVSLMNNDKDLKDKSVVKKKRKCQKKIGIRKKKRGASQKKTAQTTKMKVGKIGGELDQATSNHCVILPHNYQTQECWDLDPNENKPEQIANGLDQDNRLELYDENSTLSNEELIDLHNPNQQFNTDVFNLNYEQVYIFREHENRQLTSEDTFLASYDESNTFSNEKLIDLHHSNQLNTNTMSTSTNCQQIFERVSQNFVTSANRNVVEIQSTSKIDVATNTSPVQVLSLDLWHDFYTAWDNFSSKNEDEKRKLRAKLAKQKLKKDKLKRRMIYLKKQKLKPVSQVITFNETDSPTSSLSNSTDKSTSFDEPNDVSSPYIPNASLCLPGDEKAHKECPPFTSADQDESDFDDNEIDLLEFGPYLRLCDYSRKYYGIKDTSVDYTTLQNRVLMRDAVKFQEVLNERVNHHKHLIQTAPPDTAVKSFIEKLCEDKFVKGNCNNPSCTLMHKLPRNWCHEFAKNNHTWLIANILFNECFKPSASMYKSVLCWLGQKEKDKYKILLISEYILRDDCISSREDVWNLVIRVFLCCRLDVWESVSWLLIYHCKDNDAEIANKIIAGTGILNRSYSNFWPSVKPLTQLGIKLPLGVIQKVLREVCANDEKEVFMPIPKISISHINDEVNKLSQENASKLHVLIASFRKIYNKYFPIPNKSCLKKTEEHPSYNKLTSEEIPLLRSNTSSPQEKNMSRIMEHEKITASSTLAISIENNASIGQSSDFFAIEEISPYRNKSSSLEKSMPRVIKRETISSMHALSIENVASRAQTSDCSETGESSPYKNKGLPLKRNMPRVMECDEKTFFSKLALSSENIASKAQTIDTCVTDEILPLEKKSVTRVMEHDKITASLVRALNVGNASSIAQTIMKYCETEQYQDFVIQTLSDLMPQHKAFSLTKAIFHQINPGHDGRKAKKILARLCVTQMMELTEEKQWYQAYEFLLLIQRNHVDPVISKPIGYVCPQVKVAIACSEINYYNKNYDSAIELLINHNLLTADTCKWKIEGDSAAFELIIEHVSFLFTNIIDYTYVTKKLFLKIIEIQNDLTTPIDLVDFYEPLLCNMLEKTHEYKDQIIPFYTQVSSIDSTLFLTGLTYRALLVLSYQMNNHLFSKEMLSKAIQRLVYSPLDKEENTVIINTCMEQEEMEVYLIEWLRWVDRKNTWDSKTPLKIKFQLTRTVDHVENKELTIPSLILHSDDRMNPAICRMTSILDNFPATSLLKPDTQLIDQTLFIPATSFKILIKAAKEAY